MSIDRHVIENSTQQTQNRKSRLTCTILFALQISCKKNNTLHFINIFCLRVLTRTSCLSFHVCIQVQWRWNHVTTVLNKKNQLFLFIGDSCIDIQKENKETYRQASPPQFWNKKLQSLKQNWQTKTQCNNTFLELTLSDGQDRLSYCTRMTMCCHKIVHVLQSLLLWSTTGRPDRETEKEVHLFSDRKTFKLLQAQKWDGDFTELYFSQRHLQTGPPCVKFSQAFYWTSLICPWTSPQNYTQALRFHHNRNFNIFCCRTSVHLQGKCQMSMNFSNGVFIVELNKTVCCEWIYTQRHTNLKGKKIFAQSKQGKNGLSAKKSIWMAFCLQILWTVPTVHLHFTW